MEEKKQKLTTLLLLLLTFKLNAVLPIYPAEILGRDLNYPRLGGLGHVGVATAPHIMENAYQVLEVLNVPEHIIQLNLITTFKLSSPYWGSRYGVADRGYGALKILREGNFQRDLDCADYTILAGYEPSKGYYDAFGNAHCSARGIFRCDTFLYYLFTWGGYKLPNIITPSRIFNAFPKGNGDGPKAPQSVSTVIKQYKELKLLTSKELSQIPLADFIKIIDKPDNEINEVFSKKLLEIFASNLINFDKKIALLNKISFVGTLQSIDILLNAFELEKVSNNLNKDIISTIQHVIENNCNEKKTSECDIYKQKLSLFYKNLIQSYVPVLPLSVNVIVRGYINFSTPSEIIGMHEIINKYIDDKKRNLDARSKLTLKLELMTATRLESIYIPEIIDLLSREKKPDLDGTFNRYLIARLITVQQGGFNPETLEQIKLYLNSIKAIHTELREDLYIYSQDMPGMFDYGSWLEAYALTNHDSTNAAAKFIARFLSELETTKEQEKYVMGLSNSKYLQKAFEDEPFLNDFKKKNFNLYINSVGLN